MNLKTDNRYIAFKLLEQYFKSNLYINDITLRYFQSNNLEASNKNFINNLLLGVVRMKGKYDYILSDIYDGDYNKMKNKVRYILYIGMYQIEEMDSVPDHASISVSVDITKLLFPGLEKLVNALLRKFISTSEKYKLAEGKRHTYALLSHPNWLINRWIKNYGFKKAISICNFNNAPQSLWFRINKNREKTLTKLKESNYRIDNHKINELFFKTENPRMLIKSDIFNQGDISIQNPINGCIVDLLDVKNKDTIIDGCSAPGGKGTFAALKAPKSTIVSIDNNITRINKIKESIKRQRIQNIKILKKDMTKDQIPEANKILIDVPCTGTGVINRRLDIKWRRTQEELNTIRSIQYKILSNVAKYLKPKGIIVYSTCSIEPEENELLIKDFIDTNNFIVEDASNFVNNHIVHNGAIKVLPGEYDLDGGFAVRLRKL